MLRSLLLSFLVLSTIRLSAQQNQITAADSLYATGNYTRAINAYDKLGTVNAGLQIARAYNAIGNFEKAIAQYRAVLEKDSNLQLAAFELGKLLLKTNKGLAAKGLFERLSVGIPTESGIPLPIS